MKDKKLAQSMEDLFRNFGLKPPLLKSEAMRRTLETEKEKFVAIERVHGQERKRERDISR